MSLDLIPIAKDGTVPPEFKVPAELNEALQMTAAWFEKTGYQPPWIGYLAFAGETCVVTCGFKTPPHNGAVEIAYGSLEAHRGKGYATAAALALVQIARNADPQIQVTAQTLPGPNASTRVLAKAGFTYIGQFNHPEDGLVWEWRSDPPPNPP